MKKSILNGFTIYTGKPEHRIFKNPKISIRRNVMELNKAAMDVLGNPAYIRLYFNRSEKCIAITAGDESDDASYQIPDNRQARVANGAARKIYESLTGETISKAMRIDIDGTGADGILFFETSNAQARNIAHRSSNI